MNTITSLPPGLLILTVVLGVAFIGVGLWRALAGRREVRGYTRDIRRLIWLARGLRWFLTGLSMVGFSFGAIYGLEWLVWASIAVGAEELYECSMALAFLDKIERNERALEEGGDQVALLDANASYRPVPMWAR